MIDLYLVQDGSDRWDVITGRLQGPHTVGPFSSPTDCYRIHPCDSRLDRVPRRHRQPPHSTDSGDLAVQRSDASLLSRQVPCADKLANDLLDRLRQPITTPATVGPSAGEIGHQTRALTVAFQQHVHLSARDSQLDGGFIGSSHPNMVTLGEIADHFSTQPSLLPLSIRHR
ncbi:hypothetical protein GCM10010038_35290 [Glutamicibacter protophormiae]|nr:hypothetical protein GCM10010038_35290 [Glutamicibacter protophormiae]